MARKRIQRAAHNPPVRDPDSLYGMAEQYYAWMQVTNYSKRTIRDRRVHLGSFFAWCGDRGLVYPAEITKPIIERYQHYLFNYRKKSDGLPLSVRSQHTRLVPLRTYFKWLAKNNHILYNPASEIELPRMEMRLPKAVLSAHEAEIILNQPDVHDPIGIRDRAILEVFYSTGMRRSELIELTMYSIDSERGTVMIRQGKNKKDRLIPIGERACAWTERYLYDVRPSLAVNPDAGILFLNTHGGPLPPRYLSRVIRNYVKAADIGKQGACHLFRHTMATLMLENGADIRYIQHMLGHASLETTQIYTQLSIRKLKQVHTLTHPAKMGPPKQ